MRHMRIYRLAITRLLVLIGLLSIVAILLIPVSDAREHNKFDFSIESLRGNYALVGIGGDHSAASIGIETYDGKGNVRRTLTLNEPAENQARRVVTITGKGSYSVKPNGMGSAKITNTLPDGSTFVSDLDFVITHAETTKHKNLKLATELYSILYLVVKILRFHSSQEDQYFFHGSCS